MWKHWRGNYSWFLDADTYFGGEYFSERWLAADISFAGLNPFRWQLSFIDRSTLKKWAWSRETILAFGEKDYRLLAEKFLNQAAKRKIHENPLDTYIPDESPLDFFRRYGSKWAMNFEGTQTIAEPNKIAPTHRFVATRIGRS